jgi:pyridoxamine 5'-phosphate oxidase
MSFDFKKEPFDNFLNLYKAAIKKGVPEANAFSISTVDQNQQTSIRIVYFKNTIDNQIVFYTNYNGKKGQDIAYCNKVCANFYWPHLNQQVRIYGEAVKVTREQSEKYFSTRPRASQIGAWTSQQSQTLSSFEDFNKLYENFEKKFHGQQVPCPPNWGGYLIKPSEYEFWFGKAGRLHERYIYTSEGSSWVRSLKFP